MISKPFSTGRQGEMQGSMLGTKKSENEQEGHCGLRHGKGVGLWSLLSGLMKAICCKSICFTWIATPLAEGYLIAATDAKV